MERAVELSTHQLESARRGGEVGGKRRAEQRGGKLWWGRGEQCEKGGGMGT